MKNPTINPKSDAPDRRHLLKKWTPYALFKNWIHSRQYCDDLANEENGFEWHVVQRFGWFVVERRKRNESA